MPKEFPNLIGSKVQTIHGLTGTVIGKSGRRLIISSNDNQTKSVNIPEKNVLYPKIEELDISGDVNSLKTLLVSQTNLFPRRAVPYMSHHFTRTEGFLSDNPSTIIATMKDQMEQTRQKGNKTSIKILYDTNKKPCGYIYYDIEASNAAGQEKLWVRNIFCDPQDRNYKQHISYLLGFIDQMISSNPVLRTAFLDTYAGAQALDPAIEKKYLKRTTYMRKVISPDIKAEEGETVNVGVSTVTLRKYNPETDEPRLKVLFAHRLRMLAQVDPLSVDRRRLYHEKGNDQYEAIYETKEFIDSEFHRLISRLGAETYIAVAIQVNPITKEDEIVNYSAGEVLNPQVLGMDWMPIADDEDKLAETLNRFACAWFIQKDPAVSTEDKYIQVEILGPEYKTVKFYQKNQAYSILNIKYGRILRI